ncbi:MAG: hypothetical protein WDA71_05805 [Actinomycetota bacterium]
MNGVEEFKTAVAERLGSSFPVAGGILERAWRYEGLEIAIHPAEAPDRRLREVWRARQAGAATPLLLIAPRPGGKIAVLGPTDPTAPVREVSPTLLAEVLLRLEGKGRRDAAATLTAELERIDEAGIPGIVVRGLLTRHVLDKRLRQSPDWSHLADLAAKVRRARGWRDNFSALGFQIEQRKKGYLLRSGGAPLAVIHPFSDASGFGRTTPEGTLPEGVLVADCDNAGARWGLLATDDRFRLFKARDVSVGAATGRYLEFDLTTTQNDDWPFLGLLAPESLQPGGRLDTLLEEAIRFGEDLRDALEVRFREKALPAIARGLGRFRADEGADLAEPDVRKEIEGATFALLFRVIFLLSAEGHGYLPLGSAAYRPHAASTLVVDARKGEFDPAATSLWDRMNVLVKAMRTGNKAWGVPAYDGDLFAPSGVWGAELLERAQISDAEFGPALFGIGYDSDDADAAVDYADLEIAHIGRIYEGLLALKLSLANEDLVYDKSKERFVPGDGQKAEVAKGELFWQTESGGRKAGGVYYTKQIFVRHLVNQSVVPALQEHLAEVAALAQDDPSKAADKLFDFRVVDPAMGSAHFLADALDVISDHVESFLAENPIPAVKDLLDGLRREIHYEAGATVEDGDLLRRLVLKRCIYGVDLSQMAVEVAKISLWLAGFVPGLSLAYLGHNLRRGNSLVGVADPEAVKDTLGNFADEGGSIPKAMARARNAARRLAEIGDRTPAEVDESRAATRQLQEAVQGLEYAYGLWCAECFGIAGARAVLLTGSIEKVLEQAPAPALDKLLAAVDQEAERHSFFHWETAFPEVFARERPGFDAVIGNPPWEEVTVEELAFYALHDPGLRGLTSEQARRKRIDALVARFPHLPAEFEARQAELAVQRRFFGPEGGYRDQSGGDIDLYQLFCERYRTLAREGGYIGVVLPRSAFLVEGARGFRRWFMLGAEVRRIDFLLNSGRWAFDAEPRYTIALVAARRVPPKDGHVFFTTGPSSSQDEFAAAATRKGVPIPLARLRHWTRPKAGEKDAPIPVASLRNRTRSKAGEKGEPTLEVPLIPSDNAAAVFEKLRKGPRFDEGYAGVWSAFPATEFHETNDKKYFRHDSGWPVWKGSSFREYDPHGGEIAGYADPKEALARLQAKRLSPQGSFRRRFSPEYVADPGTLSVHRARVAFHDVTRSTDSRTVIAALVPPNTMLVNSAPYLAFPQGGEREQAFVLGLLDSLPFDWQARRFVETHLSFFVLSLLHLPDPSSAPVAEIAKRVARLSCVDERFEEFGKGLGAEVGPQPPDERDKLRAEIDALVAHAYGLNEEDLEVVFSDFTQAAVPGTYRELVRAAFKDASR